MLYDKDFKYRGDYWSSPEEDARDHRLSLEITGVLSLSDNPDQRALCLNADQLRHRFVIDDSIPSQNVLEVIQKALDSGSQGANVLLEQFREHIADYTSQKLVQDGSGRWRLE